MKAYDDIKMAAKFMDFRPSGHGLLRRLAGYWAVILRSGKKEVTFGYLKNVTTLEVKGVALLGKNCRSVRALLENKYIYDSPSWRGAFGQYIPLAKEARPPAPNKQEVLFWLMTDLGELGEFENWAVKNGYDPDSRKAETFFKHLVGRQNQFIEFCGGMEQARELEHLVDLVDRFGYDTVKQGEKT